ncbi:MAG: hypothetical protein LBH98_05955 [Chitinispirillales bacterium]|jgi:DnaJ-class molecular chaperone|nr:hypothetical protein [Chitinispirillales bacterium]
MKKELKIYLIVASIILFVFGCSVSIGGCPACDGTGYSKKDGASIICPACNGTGKANKLP